MTLAEVAADGRLPVPRRPGDRRGVVGQGDEPAVGAARCSTRSIDAFATRVVGRRRAEGGARGDRRRATASSWARRRRRCGSRSPAAPSARRCSSRSRCSGATRRCAGCGPRVGRLRRDVTAPMSRAGARPRRHAGRRRSGRSPRRRSPASTTASTSPTAVGRRPLGAVGVAIVRDRLLARARVVVGYYAVSLYQVWSTGRSDQAPAGRRHRRDGRRPVRRPAVAAAGGPARPRRRAVAAGARAARRRHRRQAARRPLHRGRGVGRATSSSAACRPTAIVLEDAGHSTLRVAARASPTLLDERGLDDVLLVTDPYHALRSRLIAEEVGLDGLRVADADQRRARRRRSPPRSSRRPPASPLGRIIGFDRL